MRAIIDFFLELAASALAFFYSLPVVGGNYGLAIILLTLSIMIVLMPLTLKATKSSIKLSSLQPKLKAVQKKYKDDRTVMNQKVLELYQEEGVNPVGGCIPILAQAPVFLLLFSVIRGITRKVEDLPFSGLAQRTWEEAGTPVSTELFAPDHLDESTDLFRDLSMSETMGFGPFDLGAQAWEIIQSNLVESIPYVLLILLVMGTSFYQQKQIAARRTSSSPAMNPQQQLLLRVFPILSGVWSLFFPAGLVLYWATSNSFRVAQQAFITRSMFSGEQQGADDFDLDDDDDDEPEEIIDVDSVEDNSTSNKEVSEREQAWEARRKAKAKKAKSKRATSKGSSRITPKGTKPKNQN